MSTFDIESLLREIRPEARCGEDLSHDGEFLTLETLLQPKPPGAIQTEGESTIVEPNWKEVREKALALLQKSRDLQVSLYLSLALLTTEGLSGLRDGLHLTAGLLEQFWDDLYPRLDPEDNNDPMQRMNILRPLSSEPTDPWDPVRFRSRLQRWPLCNARGAGGYSLRDIQLARGEITAAEGGRAAPEIPAIQAVFRGTPAEDLQNTLRAAREAINDLGRISSVFQNRTRDGSSPELGGLRQDLEKICRVVGELGEIGPGPGDVSPTDAPSPLAEKGPASAPGEIRSRHEALAAIERACRYFENHEPSSPVPLLLRRAQRLAPKTFLEIIADVCPSAIEQVTTVSGSTGSKSSDDGTAAKPA